MAEKLENNIKVETHEITGLIRYYEEIIKNNISMIADCCFPKIICNDWYPPCKKTVEFHRKTLLENLNRFSVLINYYFEIMDKKNGQ